MKYIFDFDDVLFYTTKHRKEHLIPFLEKLGITRQKIDDFYGKARGDHFSMKKLFSHFALRREELYEAAMSEYEKFANIELIDVIKTLGKDNCFIITYGDKDFQLEKIKRIGVDKLVSDIIVVVNDEKKELVEKFCNQYKNETVLFIDDKIKHLENLDFTKCPNLKTIFYDEHGLEKLKAEIGV